MGDSLIPYVVNNLQKPHLKLLKTAYNNHGNYAIVKDGKMVEVNNNLWSTL